MIRFALKNMSVKKAQLLLVLLSIVISAGVGILAYNVSGQVSDGISSNAGYYSAIIGPAGSQTQLAMNTMYFTDEPLGTIPYSVSTDLQKDMRVTSVIPFAMADSYNGYRLVGTTPAYLAGKDVAKGSMFDADGKFQVVLGANVAKLCGLSVGDEIYTSHAVGEEHKTPFTVTGILRETHSSFDNVVFTQLRSIWLVHSDEEGHEHGHEDEDEDHDHEHEHEEDEDHEHDHDHGDEDEDHEHEEEHDHDHEEHDHDHEEHDEDGELHHDHAHMENMVCAFLVKAQNPAYAMTLVNDYNGKIVAAAGGKSYSLQAIEPMNAVRAVLEETDNVKYIVFVLCGIILVMNVLIIVIITLLNMYHSTEEIRLMRLIGVSMKKINLLYMIQNAVIGLAAVCLAFGLSRLCLALMSDYVANMGVVLDIGKVYLPELAILLGIFVISILPTAVCTWRLSRQDGLRS